MNQSATSSPHTSEQEFKIGQNLLLQRGLLDHVPTRMNVGKVFVAMVHEINSRAKEDPAEILLFDRGNLESATKAARFLNHLGSVKSYGFTSELLVEKLLETGSSPRIIAAVATEKPFYQKELVSLNTSLASLFPGLVDVILPILQNSGNKSLSTFDLLYEDYPGKCRTLEVRGKALKAHQKNQKYLATLDSKNTRRELLQRGIPEGWGVCAFAQNFAAEGMKPVKVRSTKITLSKSEPDIDLGKEIVEMCWRWLATLAEFADGDLANIFLSTPYHFIAAQMAEAIAEQNPEFANVLRMKAGVYGWLSAFNLVEMFEDARYPGLIINFERFPVIDLFYVTAEKEN
jgi:hypothetical protein